MRLSVRFHAITSLLFAALASVLAIAACGCSSGNTLPPPEAVVPVETAPARIQSIANVITGEGVLYPIHQASISPKITAPVSRFYVQRGDRVHAGQLLAVLENHDLAAAVVSAEGSYDQAKATYASTTTSTLPEEIQTAKLVLKNAKTNLEAQQQLATSEQKLFREGAIARRQLDATEVALTAAQSAYQTAKKHLSNLEASGAAQQQKAAKGQLEAANGQYQAATAQLAYTQIRSPIAGAIAERAVYPGDIAPAGTPLLIVMDTSKVVVRLHIPQSQAAQLKLGDAATLQVPGFTRSFPAKLTVISPALDPNSTTIEIWIEADNPKGELKPGTSVQVSIVAQTVPNALVVPDHAILTAPDGATTVMIVKSDGRAYSRAVKTGIQQGSLIQILSGLTAGEQVIVNGAYGLPDKTKVKATPATPTVGSQAQGP
ncbi:MAG: efflux RND transporter periplasmic adaptor subunit [Acidobacteriaceae bacterium]